jgi:hypothetical protein
MVPPSALLVGRTKKISSHKTNSSYPKSTIFTANFEFIQKISTTKRLAGESEKITKQKVNCFMTEDHQNQPAPTSACQAVQATFLKKSFPSLLISLFILMIKPREPS